MAHIKANIKKELLQEWRNKSAINGVLLYTTSTIFVAYLAFSIRGSGISPIVWNTLFWIIILFSAINAIGKSFLQEGSDRTIYYYTVSSPQAIIISKMIYGVLVMLLVAFLGLGIYSVLLGNPVQDQFTFFLNLFIGSVGLATALTMISGIASKAGNNSMLMAILSFPVIIPMLLMIIKTSKNAMDGIAMSESLDEILVILALNAIIITLALLLFPYLWRN
ncbi:MAG: heme exporter protein CcmB [Cyclobacteriaceae bacterium]